METIQVDYDPARISYEKLLDVFWESHDPTRQVWSRQYMSALFFHNEEQKRLAIKTRDRQAARRGQKIYTEVRPASSFYLAEAYHQKHALRGHNDLMAVLGTLYDNNHDFVNATAMARINGYLGGYGSMKSLEEELKRLSLPPESLDKVLRILKRYDR